MANFSDSLKQKGFFLIWVVWISTLLSFLAWSSLWEIKREEQQCKQLQKNALSEKALGKQGKHSSLFPLPSP